MDNKIAARILVVDDQENWRKALIKVLSEDGHTVVTAAGYEEALAALSQSTFDIIILDVRLKDEDVFNVQGLELLREAKAKAQAPKLIVLTGYPESIYSGVLDRLGADALVLKVPPGAIFDSQGLRGQVQALLQATRLTPSDRA